VDRSVGAGNETLGKGRKLFEIFAVETKRKIGTIEKDQNWI
jgi:hypothetical protein